MKKLCACIGKCDKCETIETVNGLTKKLTRILSQDICKRCLEENGKTWSEREETNWIRGNISCPSVVAKTYPTTRCLYNEPPEWCKYTLEHIIVRKENK